MREDGRSLRSGNGRQGAGKKTQSLGFCSLVFGTSV